MNKDKKELKKKVKKGAIAATLTASILAVNSFDAPDEIINSAYLNNKNIDLNHEIANYDDVDEMKENSKSNDKLKQFITWIPYPIRIMLFLPLWIIGFAIQIGIKLLFNTIISPILGVILSIMFNSLLMIVIFLVCIKILFPNIPWRKILNIKTILIIVIINVLLSICDFVIPKYWKDYSLYRNISKFSICLVVLLILLLPFIKIFNKKRKEPEIILPSI